MKILWDIEQWSVDIIATVLTPTAEVSSSLKITSNVEIEMSVYLTNDNGLMARKTYIKRNFPTDGRQLPDY